MVASFDLILPDGSFACREILTVEFVPRLGFAASHMVGIEIEGLHHVFEVPVDEESQKNLMDQVNESARAIFAVPIEHLQRQGNVSTPIDRSDLRPDQIDSAMFRQVSGVA